MTLYENCLTLKPYYSNRTNVYKKYGLGNRIYFHLCRRGYASESGELDKEKMLKMVLDGSIWNIRGVGPSGVKEICNWLENTKDESQIQ